MELQLPEIPLLRIFSFLDAFSLLQVCQVNKYWNKVAENDHLWRNLCLRKWSFPCLSNLCPHVPTWKQFFLSQTRHERRMALAEPEDFVYKEGTGNLGILGHMAYLSESCQPMGGQEKSLLCTVSSKRMLYVWDVQEGTMIWSSPVQRCSIKFLVTLPQLRLAFTVDVEETVKVWNCQYQDALATLTMPRTSFSLEALLTKDGPFLLVGDSEGDIYMLTVPELRSISVVNAFNHSVDLLHSSPDTKWILAAGMHQRILPQVFPAECLLRPAAGRAPLLVSLPVSGCCAACWAPSRADRVMLMFRRAPFKKTGFTTFDVTTERIGDTAVIQAHQVASFMLPVHMESPVRMGVSGGDVIVFDSGPQLVLFTISGLLLQRFHDHQLTICHLWVGSQYVLTTSMDNYLHLYMWEEKGHHPYLKSCCYLEHRRGDQRPSCYVSKAICDKASIVCAVSRSRESSVLLKVIGGGGVQGRR
ncbi:F-box/WD repeat-containing protein 12 [Pteronotus mesoamericanus]|uniref:F-box/WD repeat-containing protein 12 n=1 Tax=Pteronotus mesoamericanus TaxID=1884717 RepID=UPI0023EA899A|nr:F-box/WD repeat-containing protein 12 [Pteronotus parnellii mesoamericanus]